MPAIGQPTKKSTQNSSKKNLVLISGVLAAIGIALVVYLMWYVAPEENIERVQIVAVTEAGCIVETFDGFAVNIGTCQGEPGDYVMAPIDQKLKERTAAMLTP